MTGQDERRRYIRLGPDENISCCIEGAEVLHLVGISSDGSGMRIIADRELPPEQAFAVVIDLHDAKDPIRARAKAVWQETWDFEFCNRHVAGLALLEISSADLQRLIGRIPEPSEPLDEEQL